MKRFSLRYSLLTYRLDQIWFPLAFWLLFVFIGVIRGPEYILDTTRAYLGTVIPLIGGIMAAYAILDDPALELRFATPISAAQTLLERLGLLFLIQLLSAMSFQVFAVFMKADFSMFGSWAGIQLTWLVPTLSLIAVGSLGALTFAQTMAGALLTGLVWLVQLIARGWFAGQKIGQYFLVFMGALMPDHPALRANQLTLSLSALAFLILSWMLFRRQERYI